MDQPSLDFEYKTKPHCNQETQKKTKAESQHNFWSQYDIECNKILKLNHWKSWLKSILSVEIYGKLIIRYSG